MTRSAPISGAARYCALLNSKYCCSGGDTASHRGRFIRLTCCLHFHAVFIDIFSLLEVASDVISGGFMTQIPLDDAVKFGSPSLHRSRDI